MEIRQSHVFDENETFQNQVLIFVKSRRQLSYGCGFCQALAAALKVNSSIVNLDLKHNRIGKKGAKAWHWAPRLHAALCHASEDENWRGFHLISHPSWREVVEMGGIC